jgi:hypothetical protein
LYKIKKHIAILLLGIFAFPIVFQSVHIILHHRHNIDNRHYCCQSNTQNDCTGITVAKYKTISHCPICEYQFSINKPTNLFIFKTIMPILCGVLGNSLIEKRHLKILPSKSPRAPPFLKVL